MSQIQTTHPEPRQVATFDAGAMMQAIVDKGITAESVGVMKELLAMQRELTKDSARVSFARAFAALQSDCRPIAATRAIPDKSGNIRSTFAPFEEIIREVGPLLAKHGFAVTFNHRNDGKSTTMECILTHADGHERVTPFAVRNGGGPPGCSEAQVDGGTATFAKRYALCNALNIVIDHDTDARTEGDYISEAEAVELQARVRAVCPTESDVARFLRFAGAGSFGEIRAGKLKACNDAIDAKERAKAKPADVPDFTPPEKVKGSNPKPAVTFGAIKQAVQPVEIIDADTGEVIRQQAGGADDGPAPSPWSNLNDWRRECDRLAKERGIDPEHFDKGMRLALKHRGWQTDLSSDVAFRESAIAAIRAGKFDKAK